MEKFYIGTDIGTSSVGVACTDENYNLLRAKGKDCWSVRLFDEAKTAAERRKFRTARRRVERRKQRIKWLQGLFAPYVKDETFFIRLNNSQFLPEDKNELLKTDKNTLFSGDYDDKKFHTQFPTVYHLRKALMEDNALDLRFYYLALHHIIKYRGHFLFEGNVEEIRNFKRLFINLNEVLETLYGEDFMLFDAEKVDESKIVLLNAKIGIKEKQSRLESIFGITNKIGKEIIKGFCGGKVSPSTLFGAEYKEVGNFSFKELNDEAFESMRTTYGDNYDLLSAMRSIYGFITFEKLLEGKPDISSAMIGVYDKHKKDLSTLKKFIRSERPQDYAKIFKSEKEKTNYANYIGYTKKGGRKINVKKCSDENFFKYIKNYLSSLTDVKDSETLNAIINDIENDNFLPKIIHSDNGLFPRQVNEAELNRIVANMVKFHPETIDFSDKILPLFRYRIPYYVGPLTGKNSWVVRSEEKINPWNFDEVVDKAKSNEEFMRRMTNKCSYLKGEDVLPKASIIYQKFDVLNQLNKLRINDRLLPIELKKLIFNELFLSYPKVTDKKIKDLLVRECYISASDSNEIVLSGKDGDFKASMSSYIRLKKILGDFVDKDIRESSGICEKIILWHTLNTDKSIVENLIIKNYGDIPEIKNNVKQLKGLTFKDFGKLSEKLLTGITSVDKSTGEIMTILDVLYETNENLNEILNDENYDFFEAIKEENGETDENVTYEDIEDLYVSPAIRRGIWQTLTIIDEYVRAIGKTPNKIFVEVTREDGEKGKKVDSRKRALLEKFKTVSEAYQDVIEELGNDKYSDMKLRQERLYLYFRQLGRCMYTGERIDLENLNTNLYDVDHILPRTYIKDDSLNNKVLVLRVKNAQKSDTYPLPIGFSNQQSFWKMLLDKKLIERITYDRLTRVEPLNENDYKDFINRQKTITDQTVKAVCELLQRKYPTTKIVYSKAKNVTDFKNDFDLYKCRETNDLHHARDAYLNVVVGNVYDTVFSTPMSAFRRDGDAYRNYRLKNLFKRAVVGAWNDNSLGIVKKTYSKVSMAVTKYATCYKAEFYDQTIYGKNDKGIGVSRKGKGALSDKNKYGGYKSQKTAYFAIVRSIDKKGKEIKTIENVPVLVSYQEKKNPNALKEYFESYLTKPEIIVPKIKTKQLVSYNGTSCYLSGITGNQLIVHNAVQLFTDNKTDEYVKSLKKLSDMNAKKLLTGEEERFVVKTNGDGVEKLVVDKEKNIKLYKYLIDKLYDDAYSGISSFSTFRTNLEKGKEKFVSLCTRDQIIVLLQILKFFKCNAETSDITLIEGSANSGKILINNNISNVNFSIIDYSSAGLIKRIRKV